MATKAPKKSYTTVKEVSLETLIESSKGNSASGRKLQNTGKAVWAQTVLYIHSLQELDAFDKNAEESKIAEAVRQVFKDQFIEDRVDIYGELTEECEGRNARTGKMSAILKDGEPIWSSWEETKLPISYCGDIAKAIRADIIGQLIPSANKVLSRGDTLKLAKVPEAPLDTIKRCMKLVTDKGEQIKVDDFAEAIMTVNSALESLVKASEALKAA